MYDLLVFLHVLAAFALVATVVMYTGFALGARWAGLPATLAEVMWAIGGAGTLIFGVWLALYVDGYEIWDGWIIAALVLWAASAETGRRSAVAIGAQPGGDGTVDERAMARWHALRALLVLALLLVMVFKPGA